MSTRGSRRRVKLVPVIVTGLLLGIFVWQLGWKGDSESGPADGSQAEGTTRAEAVEVIRAWAETLRRGDVRGAASYFSLPAVVQNGTTPLRLTTRAQLRRFNASLPCGARLVRTAPLGSYVTATFRLTERPGPGRCGSGEGQTAKTAFLVNAGKIREWRRLPDTRPPAPPVPDRPELPVT